MNKDSVFALFCNLEYLVKYVIGVSPVGILAVIRNPETEPQAAGRENIEEICCKKIYSV